MLVKDRDPCSYVPTWTFFAPRPGVTDARLFWRERLVDGTVGPWHEAVCPGHWPQASALESDQAGPQGGRRLPAHDRAPSRARAATSCSMLSLPYLMILQHVLGVCRSPLGAERQFAIVTTRGADDADGLFEVLYVSSWHELPGEARARDP